MKNYLNAVTLGAFTWKNGERIALLFDRVRKMGGGWIALHFLLVSLCLNFPVMLAMARLPPFELYSRLYGGNFFQALPEAARAVLGEGRFMEQGAAFNENAIDEFNLFMLANGWGKNVLLPLLGMALLLVIIIQAVFYFCAAFFVGLSRLNAFPLSFRDRLSLAVFSSTLPVLAASLFGLVLPTVHIIVFYLIVIFFIFQRSSLCANG
jgi:hypothetical protein